MHRPYSYERANTDVEWISTLPQRDTVFPSYHPYSISADLPVGHCPGILAVPFAVACHSTPARCRTDPVYHPVNRAEKLRGPLEFPVEHGLSVAAAVHLTAPAAALLPALSAGRTRAAISAVWARL